MEDDIVVKENSLGFRLLTDVNSACILFQISLACMRWLCLCHCLKIQMHNCNILTCVNDYISVSIVDGTCWLLQDISLAGWQLKQTVGDTEVVYKFHRSSSLKAGQYVTVS